MNFAVQVFVWLAAEAKLVRGSPQCVQAVEKLCPQGAEDPAASHLGVRLWTVRHGGPCPLQHPGSGGGGKYTEY